MQTALPTINRYAIPFAHWSMRVTRGASGAAWGEIVDQLDDLEQGIANLVLTPKRSVPTEPTKGCDLAAYMDRPPAIAIPGLKVEIWNTLFTWHTRIRLDAVDVVAVDDGDGGFSHFRAPVFWFPVDGVLETPIETLLELRRDASFASGVVLQ